MAYEQMASVYDQLMNDAPYDQWTHFTKGILSQEQEPVQHIIDLGCGTGRITVDLARRGFEMTGIDYSNNMLSQADQFAKEQQVNIDWICQDLRELDGIPQMDAAVSYCDVINYITTEKELRTVFLNIADLLKPGGLFIFDVHSMFVVNNHLINQTFADVTDLSSYIWFCIEGDDPGEMYHDLTFFSKIGQYYEKFSEIHHQRTFPVEVYKHLLSEAGFECCYLYGDFSLKQESASETTERIFIVARNKTAK